MKTKKHPFLIKIFAVIFTVGVCFSGYSTPRAEAQWTVIDPTNLFQNITTALSTALSSATNIASLSWDTVGKNLLDYAIYSASQRLLTQLTNNTVSWVQGGFHGSPAYSVDTKAIGKEIADGVAGEIVHSIKNAGVCDFKANYKDDLANKVQISTAVQTYKYSQQAKCPFKEDINFKASDFYAGTTRFGWSNFSNALQDGGNPYGIEMLTAQEKAQRVGLAKNEKEKKLSWSNGYADIKDTTNCNYPAELFAIPNDPNDPSTQFNDILPIVTAADATQRNNAIWSDPALVKSLQDAYCKTTTPGKIVEDQLTQALGEDVRRIGFADNMNKIVAAFLDTLTQKTIRGVFGSANSGANAGGARNQGAPIGAAVGGTGTANMVKVTTVSECATPSTLTPPDSCAITTADTAVIKGTVIGAIAPANVNVWFTWSNLLNSTIVTGTITGTTLDVTSVSSGRIVTGQIISDAGNNIVAGTTIGKQLTGITGSTGTYAISPAQSLPTPLTITAKTAPANITWIDMKNPILTAPTPGIKTQQASQNFLVTLIGLTPGTTYYYNANVSTSQFTPDADLHGKVYIFKTK